MRCVGYRQACEALDADALANKPGVPGWRDKGIFATRQLAKRQITWLRSMPQRITVAADAPNAVQQVLDRVNQLVIGKAAA
jgi:tRNA dimethylallyltransferase